MTSERIETDRLILRRACPEDLEAMHLVLSNEMATRFWSTPAHRSIEETREWLQGMIEAPPDQSHDFVVEHQGEVIGKAGFFRLPEIGFILRPDRWGKGLAREAVRAVIDSAFRCFDPPALTADVDPRNRASLALLQSQGFEVTRRAKRTFFINGEWADSVYLALDRSRQRTRG